MNWGPKAKGGEYELYTPTKTEPGVVAQDVDQEPAKVQVEIAKSKQEKQYRAIIYALLFAFGIWAFFTFIGSELWVIGIFVAMLIAAKMLINSVRGVDSLSNIKNLVTWSVFGLLAIAFIGSFYGEEVKGPREVVVTTYKNTTNYVTSLFEGDPDARNIGWMTFVVKKGEPQAIANVYQGDVVRYVSDVRFEGWTGNKKRFIFNAAAFPRQVRKFSIEWTDPEGTMLYIEPLEGQTEIELQIIHNS